MPLFWCLLIFGGWEYPPFRGAVSRAVVKLCLEIANPRHRVGSGRVSVAQASVGPLDGVRICHISSGGVL